MSFSSKSDLKYNPDIVKKKLKQVGDKVICTEDISILFPEWYVKKELAFLGSTVNLVCIACVVDSSNNYAILEAPIYAEFGPERLLEQSIDGVPYKIMTFSKDNIVILSTRCIKTDNFLYELFNSFFVQGNIPFFLDYEGTSKVFLESKKYADSNIGSDSIIFEIITAIVTRNDKNKMEYWRQTINNGAKGSHPYPIGLSNVYYAYDSTGAKIIGSFFEQGLINAVNNPENKPTKTVEVLRY